MKDYWKSDVFENDGDNVTFPLKFMKQDIRNQEEYEA